MIPQEDPFASVRLNKKSENKIQPMQENQNSNFEDENEDPFAAVRLKNNQENSEEGYVSKGLRHVSRTASRTLETILGMPGDFQALSDSIIQPLIDKLIPISEENKKIRQQGKLPTSQQLKEKSIELTKGYTKPKNRIESIGDEVASSLTSLIGPMKFRKALGVAAGSQIAKESAGLLGFEPNIQEATKLGTTIFLSMLNPNGIKKFWTNKYNQVEKLTPKGTVVNAKPLEVKVKKVISELERGTQAPSEAKVLNQAEKVLEKIKDGKVDLHEMISVKRSLNEIAGDPEVFKRAEHIFPQLQKAVNDAIKLHPNRNAIKEFYQANQAFGGYQQSRKLSNFITRHLPTKPLAGALITTFGEAALGHPELIVPTLAGAGASTAAVKGFELIHRILANSTTRKYYRDLIQGGLKQSAPEVTKSYNRLEKELEKDH